MAIPILNKVGRDPAKNVAHGQRKESVQKSRGRSLSGMFKDSEDASVVGVK